MRLCRVLRIWHVCVRVVCMYLSNVYVSRIKKVLKTRKEAKKKTEVHSFHFHSFIAFFVVHCWNVDETPNNLYPAKIPRNFITLVNQIVHLDSSYNESCSLTLLLSWLFHSSSFNEYDDMMLTTATAKLAMVAHTIHLPRGQYNNEQTRWVKKEKIGRSKGRDGERNSRDWLVSSHHMFFKIPLTASI